MTPLADGIRTITDKTNKLSISEMVESLEERYQDWDLYKKLTTNYNQGNPIDWEIPEKITTLNFSLCSGENPLAAIKIVAKGVTRIPKLFASHCKNIQKMIFPSAEAIDRSSFEESVFQEDGEYDFTKVKSIDYKGFYNATLFNGFLTDNFFPNLMTEGVKTSLFSNTKNAGEAVFNQWELVPITCFSGSDLISFQGGNVKAVHGQAFYNCSKLAEVSLPLTETFNAFCFWGCAALKELDFPKGKTFEKAVFFGCTSLEKIIFGANSEDFCFKDILATSNTLSSLKTIIFSNQLTPPILETDGIFNAIPFSKGDSFIYVPDEVVEDYKVATNWVTYADYIKPLSEYVEVEETTE